MHGSGVPDQLGWPATAVRRSGREADSRYLRQAAHQPRHLAIHADRGSSTLKPVAFPLAELGIAGAAQAEVLTAAYAAHLNVRRQPPALARCPPLVYRPLRPERDCPPLSIRVVLQSLIEADRFRLPSVWQCGLALRLRP